jgi:hypothetical protein
MPALNLKIALPLFATDHSFSEAFPFPHNYYLQFSLDLTNWVNLSTNSGGRISGTDSDSPATKSIRRFYRFQID